MRRGRLMVLALLLSIMLIGSARADIKADFTAANKFYQDKLYDSAALGYEAIRAQGLESSALYFNLGNTYFKQGDLGHAVLNYLRAQRLDPSDDDILENLEFARQFTRVQMEGVQLNPVSSLIESLLAPYRLKTLGWLSSGLFMLFMLSLILSFGLGFRGSAIRVTTTISLILLVLVAGLTTFKYRVDYLSRQAVVVAEESSVRTGPSDKSDIELEAAPGLVVEITGESQGYYNVLFENKRQGWLPKQAVVEL
ncbi:MAG: tetratricopeptide repeat protein [bacterium]|nr:tetratricopeptide repeat protein [bacterium]